VPKRGASCIKIASQSKKIASQRQKTRCHDVNKSKWRHSATQVALLRNSIPIATHSHPHHATKNRRSSTQKQTVVAVIPDGRERNSRRSWQQFQTFVSAILHVRQNTSMRSTIVNC